MRPEVRHSAKRRKQQRGIIMLLIMLLVLMFTGLGLLAMRHTRGELQTTGAYLDSIQAAALAEAAITMTATDLRLYVDYACVSGDGNNISYDTQYNSGFFQGERPMSFSPAFQDGKPNECDAGVGELPDPQLGGRSSLADTGVLSTPRASVQVFHSPRVPAPFPPGTSEQENQTFGYFWYTVRATATYGEPAEAHNITTGQATARARMYIGPHRTQSSRP